MTLPSIRRALGIAGTVLLGGALALAPIAAFGGDMRIVSGTGIAGPTRLLFRPSVALNTKRRVARS